MLGHDLNSKSSPPNSGVIAWNIGVITGRENRVMVHRDMIKSPVDVDSVVLTDADLGILDGDVVHGAPTETNEVDTAASAVRDDKAV